jgi:hypothetical protein
VSPVEPIGMVGAAMTSSRRIGVTGRCMAVAQSPDKRSSAPENEHDSGVGFLAAPLQHGTMSTSVPLRTRPEPAATVKTATTGVESQAKFHATRRRIPADSAVPPERDAAVAGPSSVAASGLCAGGDAATKAVSAARMPSPVAGALVLRAGGLNQRRNT